MKIVNYLRAQIHTLEDGYIPWRSQLLVRGLVIFDSLFYSANSYFRKITPFPKFGTRATKMCA